MAVVKIGTDCSGMEAPVQALQNLAPFGVSLEHEFSCDVNAYAKDTITANFHNKIWYEDLTKRDNAKAPYVDIYVAGFPCQPFSAAGLGQGFADTKGRGKIFFKVLDYIKVQQPRIFLLENVKGLTKLDKGRYLQAIMSALEGLGTYNIYSQVLNTRDHGVPQCRNRWYCVGILKKHDKGTFTFPEAIAKPDLELFLEPKTGDMDLRRSHRNETSKTARTNIQKAIRDIPKKGLNPLADTCMLDCDSSPGRNSFVHQFVPCLTCGRARGHWIINRGRRLLPIEMHRLQGMDPAKFKVAVPERKHGFQLGNTMSVNVLERLFLRLLPAAGLASAAKMRDRWASGEAVRELVKAREFQEMDAGTFKKLQEESLTFKRFSKNLLKQEGRDRKSSLFPVSKRARK